jgi:hypothetical protein
LIIPIKLTGECTRMLQRLKLKLKQSLFILIGGVILTLPLANRALAAPPSLYFSQVNVMATGSDLYVEVRANSLSTPVNAVQADFTYPTNVLTYVGVSSSGTAYPTIPPSGGQTGGNGHVSLQQGIAPGTTLTGDQLVATVRFSVTGSGNAALAFENTSVLLANAGSTNILSETLNKTISSITGPLIPVYRLANMYTNQHIFTTSLVEHDYAIAHYAGWHTEGISFYAYQNSTAGTIPVYRLANTYTNEHIFTTSLVEHDYAIAHYAGWHTEGISFYASPQ